MSKDKDPRIDHPGRPHPKPKERPDERSPREGESDDAGVTEQAASEGDEPIENRFPDESSGEHRESG